MGSLSAGSGGAADYDALEKAVMAFPDKAESTARMFRLMLPRGGADSVCVFAEGDCLPAALAVSDLADSVGGIPIAVVDDGRIPGRASGGTCAVVMTDLPGGPDPDLIKGLEDRGCDVSILKRGGEKGGWNTVVMPAMLSIETLAFSLGYLCTLLTNRGVLDAASALGGAASTVRACRDVLPEAAGRAAASLNSGIVAACSPSAASAVAVRAADAVRRYALEPALQGTPSEGPVPVIIGCMEEALRENGVDVAAAPTAGGSSLAGDMIGFMAIELIAGRMVLRWPAYRSTGSSAASWTTSDRGPGEHFDCGSIILRGGRRRRRPCPSSSRARGHVLVGYSADPLVRTSCLSCRRSIPSSETDHIPVFPYWRVIPSEVAGSH